MSGLELRLPAIPRDAHVVAAEAMLLRLSAAFSSAGLGITGSVARGSHGPRSDVDLVVVDASFRHQMQFATVSEGIRTAILCLRPQFDAERERRWMLAASEDVPRLSMVRSAFVARDPGGVLSDLKRTLERLHDERHTRCDELMHARRNGAIETVRALYEKGGAGNEHLMIELLTTIIDGWYLKNGLAMSTRKASERILDKIAGHDPAVYALLREAVPLTHASVTPLLRAFDYVFSSAEENEYV